MVHAPTRALSLSSCQRGRLGQEKLTRPGGHAAEWSLLLRACRSRVLPASGASRDWQALLVSFARACVAPAGCDARGLSAWRKAPPGGAAQSRGARHRPAGAGRRDRGAGLAVIATALHIWSLSLFTLFRVTEEAPHARRLPCRSGDKVAGNRLTAPRRGASHNDGLPLLHLEVLWTRAEAARVFGLTFTDRSQARADRHVRTVMISRRSSTAPARRGAGRGESSHEHGHGGAEGRADARELLHRLELVPVGVASLCRARSWSATARTARAVRRPERRATSDTPEAGAGATSRSLGPWAPIPRIAWRWRGFSDRCGGRARGWRSSASRRWTASCSTIVVGHLWRFPVCSPD